MKIVDNRAFMRRGDDDSMTVNVKANGVVTALKPTETLTLTVRKLPLRESPVIFSSTSAPGSNTIVIRPEDTKDAEYGEYSADVEMLTEDGLRKTVWPELDVESSTKKEALSKCLANFVLFPEVTMYE